MIIGSGMLARAFSPAYSHRQDVCVYAAGVSNSSCNELPEFVRERERLRDALRQANHVDAFVYFGTCSVADTDVKDTFYVQHKLDMEKVVRAHPRNLIFRLPQVAGKTTNPHTLLNFLHARISRRERFNLWSKATRNIIDVDDVALISQHLISTSSLRNTTINLANVVNYKMAEIVSEMEHVVGKQAIYDVVDRGSDYLIDTSAISSVLGKVNLNFGSDYLKKVIEKYY